VNLIRTNLQMVSDRYRLNRPQAAQGTGCATRLNQTNQPIRCLVFLGQGRYLSGGGLQITHSINSGTIRALIQRGGRGLPRPHRRRSSPGRRRAGPHLPLRPPDPEPRKRALWERTWDLQRREDRGETVEIPVPPKYDSKDFLKGTYWKHRGKLDVPKEEFILYPGAEREVDPAPVVGWAGWDHLQRAKALSAYYERARMNEGWPQERLLPLLAGLHELLPWLKQWHDAPDPDFGVGMGAYFEQYLDEECRALGTLPQSLPAWRPPAGRGGRGGPRARKAAK